VTLPRSEPKPRARPEPDFSGTLARDAEPQPLDRALRALLPGKSWGEVRRLIESGKVRVLGRTITDPTARVGPGAEIRIYMKAREPGNQARLTSEAVVFVDTHVVVVNKPAGISTVPYEDERDTLDRQVRGLLRRLPNAGRDAPLGVVQRLDKETTGLLVFARTLPAKRHLQQQLRAHSVKRRYLALAHGEVKSGVLRSRLVTDRGDGLRGSTKNPRLGRESITHVTALEALSRATLIECRLETGRTHQIRIHLSEAGHPLLGERVYVRRYSGPLLDAPRVMLHATELGFLHPISGRPMHFTRLLPDDMDEVLARLRSKPSARE
jgi:23S rRNA pseudouridine1911/1915/1917 synthase